MSWSTVEWPPKNKTKLKPQSKARQRIVKFTLLLFLFTTVLLMGFFLGQADWRQSVNAIQKRIVPINQYLNKEQTTTDVKKTSATTTQAETTSAVPEHQPIQPQQTNVASTQQPTQQLTTTVSRSGEHVRYTKEYQMLATAYTHTGNPTASGVWPQVGVAAVDTNVIPMGTRLYVEGYGYATALDRGGAIKGHRIDLFMDTESQALQWGAQKVKVYIVD